MQGRVLRGGYLELGKRKPRSCERRFRTQRRFRTERRFRTKRAGPGCPQATVCARGRENQRRLPLSKAAPLSPALPRGGLHTPPLRPRSSVSDFPCRMLCDKLQRKKSRRGDTLVSASSPRTSARTQGSACEPHSGT